MTVRRKKKPRTRRARSPITGRIRAQLGSLGGSGIAEHHPRRHVTSREELCRFAGALLKLYLRLPGPVDQVDVDVDDDGKTIVLMGYDVAGNYAMASYEAPEGMASGELLDELREHFSDVNTAG